MRTEKRKDVDQKPGILGGTVTHTKNELEGQVSPEKWEKKMGIIRMSKTFMEEDKDMIYNIGTGKY